MNASFGWWIVPGRHGTRRSREHEDAGDRGRQGTRSIEKREADPDGAFDGARTTTIAGEPMVGIRTNGTRGCR